MHPEINNGIVAHAAHRHEIAYEEHVRIVQRIAFGIRLAVHLHVLDRLIHRVNTSLLTRVVLAARQKINHIERVIAGSDHGLARAWSGRRAVKIVVYKRHVRGYQAVQMNRQPTQQEQRNDYDHDFD